MDVWKNSFELVQDIYKRVLPAMPDVEKYNLTSQIRRSAASIPANIAEGYGRFYYQSNILFCYNARGSLEELISHLLLAIELKYIPEELGTPIIQKADNLVVLINGYIVYLKRSKQGEKEMGDGLKIKESPVGYKLSDFSVSFNDSLLSILDSRPTDVDSDLQGE